MINESKDDFRLNTSRVANNPENTVEGVGDKIKPGIKAMTNKIKDPMKIWWA
jgi:hypothetical protein